MSRALREHVRITCIRDRDQKRLSSPRCMNGYPAIVLLEGNLAMDWHPIQGGSSNIPSQFMLQKQELSAGLMGHLARMQTLPFYLKSCNYLKIEKYSE